MPGCGRGPHPGPVAVPAGPPASILPWALSRCTRQPAFFLLAWRAQLTRPALHGLRPRFRLTAMVLPRRLGRALQAAPKQAGNLAVSGEPHVRRCPHAVHERLERLEA